MSEINIKPGPIFELYKELEKLKISIMYTNGLYNILFPNNKNEILLLFESLIDEILELNLLENYSTFSSLEDLKAKLFNLLSLFNEIKRNKCLETFYDSMFEINNNLNKYSNTSIFLHNYNISKCNKKKSKKKGKACKDDNFLLEKLSIFSKFKDLKNTMSDVMISKIEEIKSLINELNRDKKKLQIPLDNFKLDNGLYETINSECSLIKTINDLSFQTSVIVARFPMQCKELISQIDKNVENTNINYDNLKNIFTSIALIADDYPKKNADKLCKIVSQIYEKAKCKKAKMKSLKKFINDNRLNKVTINCSLYKINKKNICADKKKPRKKANEKNEKLFLDELSKLNEPLYASINAPRSATPFTNINRSSKSHIPHTYESVKFPKPRYVVNNSGYAHIINNKKYNSANLYNSLKRPNKTPSHYQHITKYPAKQISSVYASLNRQRNKPNSIKNLYSQINRTRTTQPKPRRPPMPLPRRQRSVKKKRTPPPIKPRSRSRTVKKQYNTPLPPTPPISEGEEDTFSLTKLANYPYSSPSKQYFTAPEQTPLPPTPMTPPMSPINQSELSFAERLKLFQ